MNIRGTDPAANATVTDLFAVTALARNAGSNDFQRALQPPSAPKWYTPASDSKPTKPSESANNTQSTAPSQPATTAADKHPDDADEVADGNEVAQAAGELPAEEEADERDVAAASLAAAANQVSQPQPNAKQVPAELLHVDAAKTGDEVVEAAAGETINPDIAAEQAPIALPTEQTATASGVAKEQVAGVETIQELQASTAEEGEPTGGIGVMPSAVATTTAVNGQAVPTRPTTARGARDGQDRSVHVKQSTSTGDATAAEATSEVPAEPASGSPMVNPNKRNSQESSDKGEAFAQTATPTPYIDPAATATLTQDSAVVEPANQAAADATSAANKPQDPPLLQSAAPANMAAAIVNRLPGQALVRHAASAAPEAAPLHVDAARFLQRVTKAFESAHERGGEIRLRLSPPELGALRVEVTMHEQGLVARLEVETNEARAVLLENLPVLRERLAEQGLRLERFDVDLSRREPDQPGGHLPDQPRDRQSQGAARQARNVPQRQPTPPNSPTIPSPTTGWQDRQLNVIV